MAIGSLVPNSYEVPRLSSSIRTFVRDRGIPLDVDLEFIRRKEALRQLREQQGSSAASSSHGPLSSMFARAPPRIRSALEKFLVAARDLLGGEMPSHELQEAAVIVLNVLKALPAGATSAADFASQREEMRRQVGFISDDVALWKQCAELANQMLAWQQEEQQSSASLSSGDIATPAAAATPAPTATAVVRDAAHGANEPEEFGSSFEFSAPFPGSFLQSLDLQRLQRFGEEEEEVRREGQWAAGSSTEMFLPPDESFSGRSGSAPDGRGEEEWEMGGVFGSSGVGGGEGVGDEGMSSGSERGLRWFREQCVRAAGGGGGAQFSGDELALAVLKVLESNRSGDEIAGELFDLIGDGGFDFIQELLQNRKTIVTNARDAISVLRDEREASDPSKSKAPRHGSMVSVQTESDRILEKLRRKEDRKQARARGSGAEKSTGLDPELAWLAEAGGFGAILAASENKNRTKDMIDALVGTGDEAVSLRTLPAGTKRKVVKGYEEVTVPASVTAGMLPSERLVKVEEMEPFAQAAFEGFKTLNRIQSRIYRKAFYSNENLLVCAPTGAGKTNIAMITILHELGQNFDSGILQKNNFKIVYVAPMKALAAEMTAAFGRRLAPLGVAVRELTGDMQLSKREMEETQMIVTTPEKWDVITRKSADTSLASLVRLLVIDEVHLLNDERGPVIETIVARTLRQVESSQSMIRIVGLSATLPNYRDVAQFLRVNLQTGLFYFDASYRPVPLTQHYVGVTENNFARRSMLMHEIAYQKALDAVKNGKQAMVFVHSRKDTVKTARILVESSQKAGETALFDNADHPQQGLFKKEVQKSRNRELGELFQAGFGIHHAGMLRSDRNLTEKMFSEGLLKVLVCTATLAWGVNLPAHTVIIKGTQLYDPKAGGFRELGMLDVMQIFGRAGRPQFDTSGEGIIITTHGQLAHYLRLLTHQLPIESQFVAMLKDNLNAEVVLGTVSNVREATTWLGYTYLFVRMQSNPLAYGITWEELSMDPRLVTKRKALIVEAARALDRAKMMKFDERSGNMYMTELGRVASHFYIRYTSVETYNEMLKRHMNEGQVINLVAHSSEFENIVVREEEQQELLMLKSKYCPLEVKGGPEDKIGKINILIQVFLSRGYLDSFSLIADSAYITTSLGRIMRALFEICQRRGWCTTAALLLEFCKAVERRVWPHQQPMRQFEELLPAEVCSRLEGRSIDLDGLYEMDEKELSNILRVPQHAKTLIQCMQWFPHLDLDASISPITRTVLQVTVTIIPQFVWKDRVHGASEKWWIWVEDTDNEHIYHTEYFSLTRKMMNEPSHTLSFSIPIFEPLPAQYLIRAVNDSWLGATSVHTISFKHLILPERHPPHTELLSLRPLPVSAVGNAAFQSLFSFSHFNPIQTQAFHSLFHSDSNVLLGAPTGSGKTVSAELTMCRLFSAHPGMKVIYIAPLKALVRERMDDWKQKLEPRLGKKVVELTGDVTPDLRALMAADVIIATPEKWDGITRNWHSRAYAQVVGLMILDEIHLLGQERGAVLEVIVSRMRYIAAQTERPIRFVGLSTALANARDLGEWLGVPASGLFNFKPSVRPVPLDVHIQGFPGRFYCPRMNAMNKPLYAALTTHSPLKPILIFVSSRRQTRLTALDLIQYAAADEKPRQFVHVPEEEMEEIISAASSAELKHTLRFGIGLHHAGLTEKDRGIVEDLFSSRKIQVLICTSTLAWGVNLPAHLVVVKGTEYFDGATRRYVDFPITDVLQMMGRAGRPQFDSEAKAVIMVHEPKKSFYKKFLYEPFPVESSLPPQLHDHLNAEVAGGSISSVQDCVDYLTWTFFFRRLTLNPSYYHLSDATPDSISLFLSDLVSKTLIDLERAGCVTLSEDGSITATAAGSTASHYYLHFTTIALFTANIKSDATIPRLLQIISGAAEYDLLPVRHNEDKINADLAKVVRLKVDGRTLDDPHTKTNLLLQCHFGRLLLPMSDYETDLKSVLDQSLRIVQAMVDCAAHSQLLLTALSCMRLAQMIVQALWWDVDSPFQMLPHGDKSLEDAFAPGGLRGSLEMRPERVRTVIGSRMGEQQAKEFMNAWLLLPHISMSCHAAIRAIAETERGSGEGSGAGGEAAEGGGSGSGKTEMALVVTVNLQRRRRRSEQSLRSYSPYFPKVKEEAWWLVVGSSVDDQLLALKRVSFTTRITANLQIDLAEASRIRGKLKVFLVCDSYIGLDHEVEVDVPKGMESFSMGPSMTESVGIKGSKEVMNVDDGGDEDFFDAK